MLVGCPRCKVRLKVPDEKIGPQGTRFKCPKCAVVLLVKRPAPKPEQQKNYTLNAKKVLVAHPDQSIADRVGEMLENEGFIVLKAADGVEAMVQAMKELPFLVLLDVALPKIYGFELAKRLKERPETKGIKSVLLSSIYDKSRYRREPASLYGADDYLDEHQIEELLMDKIKALTGQGEPRANAPETEKAGAASSATDILEKYAPPRPEPPAGPELPPKAPAFSAPRGDAMVEKARRLARTIMADINLYSPQKVEASIRENSFFTVFASELREGKKLYDNRIPPDVRSQGDFFREAVENFIEGKKKTLGIN
ncbi:MAG: zinc-ribbon domain-containing protein [Nitrospiraceae bacterium]|nr:zinc-ribbon domain-containing protein [Nitrospiraceae bacterium]